MTTNDLQAARERYRNDAYPNDPQGDYQHRDDAFDLADAYLSLLDETPITEEWLDQIPQIEWHEKSAFGWWVEMGFESEGGRQIQGHAQTRGAVRALLLAMGVTHDI